MTKSKTVFPSDDSLLKMLYLATMDITKKWTGHRQDWGQIHSQLEIYFEEHLIGRNPVSYTHLDVYKRQEYKAYYLFAEQMERTDELFSLTEQEKLTLEYLSKTILSGVRPDELEILRLLLEKNRITYSEIIDDCKQRYSYEITNEKIDAACEVLKLSLIHI